MLANNHIIQTADLTVCLSSRDDDSSSIRHYTVAGTDLLIRVDSDHVLFASPEEQERIEVGVRAAVVSYLTEIQGL